MKREAESLRTTPAELAAELAADASPKCNVDGCKMREGLQLFAIAVDGVPLEPAIRLCGRHSCDFLLRVGGACADVVRQIPARWSEP